MTSRSTNERSSGLSPPVAKDADKANGHRARQRTSNARRATAPSRSDNSAENLRIGGRLRHARLVQGYSLHEVAGFAGVSESYVSKLENNKVQPSLSTLHRLANALNTNIGALVAETSESEGPVTVVSSGQRPEFCVSGDGGNKKIILQKLVPSTPGSLLQINIHVIATGAEEDLIRHAGQEFGFVLEGELELRVDGHTFDLSAGDAFSFDSHLPHGYQNTGDRTVRVLWVNTPPTF